jgi:hypothetical protein
MIITQSNPPEGNRGALGLDYRTNSNNIQLKRMFMTGKENDYRSRYWYKVIDQYHNLVHLLKFEVVYDGLSKLSSNFGVSLPLVLESSEISPKYCPKLKNEAIFY